MSLPRCLVVGVIAGACLLPAREGRAQDCNEAPGPENVTVTGVRLPDGSAQLTVKYSSSPVPFGRATIEDQDYWTVHGWLGEPGVGRAFGCASPDSIWVSVPTGTVYYPKVAVEQTPGQLRFVVPAAWFSGDTWTLEVWAHKSQADLCPGTKYEGVLEQVTAARRLAWGAVKARWK